MSNTGLIFRIYKELFLLNTNITIQFAGVELDSYANNLYQYIQATKV